MKYKVGDKVRVRKNLVDGKKYGNCYYGPFMDRYEGRTLFVSEARDGYYSVEGEYGNLNFSEEMLEPADDMSEEETIKWLGGICESHGCVSCPIGKINVNKRCNEIRIETPEKVVEVIKKYKADHEKKSIETEFRWVIRVIEDTGTGKRCVYEERLPKDVVDLGKPQSDILKKYCAEHEGKFFTTREKICVVKE